MSVWDDIADTAEEAENLKVRAALMRTTRAQIQGFRWTQTTAATNLGLTQPRVSALMRGKVSEFSLDALVAIAAKVGVHVQVVPADNSLDAHPISQPG